MARFITPGKSPNKYARFYKTKKSNVLKVIRISLNSGSDFSGVVDAPIREANPTTNYDSADFLALPNFDIAFTAVGDRTNTLIKFTGLSNVAPGTVLNAKLRIYMLENNSGSVVVNANALLRNYVNNQATWNVFSTGNSWQTPGGLGALDISSTLLGQFTTGTPNQYYEFSSAALNTYVENILNGTVDNGILLSYADQVSSNGYTKYYSSEAADGFRPELVFSLTPTSGSIVIASGKSQSYAQASSSATNLAKAEAQAASQSTANRTQTASASSQSASQATATNVTTARSEGQAASQATALSTISVKAESSSLSQSANTVITIASASAQSASQATATNAVIAKAESQSANQATANTITIVKGESQSLSQAIALGSTSNVVITAGVAQTTSQADAKATTINSGQAQSATQAQASSTAIAKGESQSLSQAAATGITGSTVITSGVTASYTQAAANAVSFSSANAQTYSQAQASAITVVKGEAQSLSQSANSQDTTVATLSPARHTSYSKRSSPRFSAYIPSVRVIAPVETTQLPELLPKKGKAIKTVTDQEIKQVANAIKVNENLIVSARAEKSRLNAQVNTLYLIRLAEEKRKKQALLMLMFDFI